VSSCPVSSLSKSETTRLLEWFQTIERRPEINITPADYALADKLRLSLRGLRDAA
jgi:hypothetical protein